MNYIDGFHFLFIGVIIYFIFSLVLFYCVYKNQNKKISKKTK